MAKEAGEVISLREETGQARSLDDRIADAFDSEMTAAALAELLREVEETSEAAKAESKAASTLALDPRLRPADVADARQKMQDADFRSNRLDVAADQLKTLLEAAQRREAAVARAAEYAAAKAERDQLVKDLAAYETHAAAIVDLLERVSRNQSRLKKANAARDAEEWIFSAEMIARGAEREFGITIDTRLPDLCRAVKLPRFKRDPDSIHGYAWPPKSAL